MYSLSASLDIAASAGMKFVAGLRTKAMKKRPASKCPNPSEPSVKLYPRRSIPAQVIRRDEADVGVDIDERLVVRPHDVEVDLVELALIAVGRAAALLPSDH